MKHSFLDRYSDRDSFVHRFDPRVKLVTVFFFVLAVALTSPGMWAVYVVYFYLVAALILLSKLPVIFVLKRSMVIIPFVALMAIFIPFTRQGEAAGSFNFWLRDVSVTQSGLQVLWNILAKAWLSMLGLILLTSTTRMADLLAGLERLRMPRVMVMTLSFMYRYIFVLADEVMRMRQARDSRGKGVGRRQQLQTIGRMAGTLFIRSYERGERVYNAMLSRGYDGQCRTLGRLSLKPADFYFSTVFGIIIFAICVFNFTG